MKKISNFKNFKINESITDELDTIEKRKEYILKYNELNLLIKGEGYTNLRILPSKKDNIIYFRIDKAGNFDYPMSEIKYLENDHPELNILCDKYGFDKATIDDIDDILEITKDMKETKKHTW